MQLFGSTHKEQNRAHTALASSCPDLASKAKEENPGSVKINTVGPKAVSHSNLVCVPCGNIKMVQKVPPHVTMVNMCVKMLMKTASRYTVTVPEIHLLGQAVF